jgi:uncharacterized protein
MSGPEEIPAGDFGPWLQQMRKALAEPGGIEVTCGDCRACCTSSLFVHIAADDVQTLARIPRELLFPAPGLPRGNMVLGYDESGRCPMLIKNECSIYENRPRTCRTYDCRVFAAAGIRADRDLIAQRARCWRFSYRTADEGDQHAAVRAAARFLEDHAECFPGGAVPRDPAQAAILAIRVHTVFLARRSAPGQAWSFPSNQDIAEAMMRVNMEET